MNEFCYLILSHRRPNNVQTEKTLRAQNAKRPIFILVDDEDPTLDEYLERYGEQVVVFSKKAIGKTFDQGDNFDSSAVVVYARNAAWEAVRSKGFRYFIELDDDYSIFWRSFKTDLSYWSGKVRDIDEAFQTVVDYLAETPSIATLAISQGGDWFGGQNSQFLAVGLRPKRKVMNGFAFDVERPIVFPGRLNEDVNLYTEAAHRGALMFTIPHLRLKQSTTQGTSGGMTEAYLSGGTFVKSFYSVMRTPSAVSISTMGVADRRIHHRVSYNACAPKVLAESWRKP